MSNCALLGVVGCGLGLGGCGPVHKPFVYHAGARRSFPGGDNATPQTAKQTANKGCTTVHQKVAPPSGHS